MPARIRIGTCSWTDPSLIRAGTFYPATAQTAEARLNHYASQFDLVEVDSSYYAMPSRRNATLWTERTPPGFVFDVKAFRLFTGHPTQPQALPADIRGALPSQGAQKKNLYYRDIPGEMLQHLWSRFTDALMPLDSAGKLGVVLLQFPPWFHPGVAQMDHILACREQLAQHDVAVEFRNNRWLSEHSREATLSFLREHQLAFVCVDEPQGFTSSVPPLAETTADTAIIRFHGRKASAWEAKNTSPSDRFDYYYAEEELRPWVDRVRNCAGNTSEVHILFNTNNGDQGVVNARLMARLLL
ncbi:MAG: DUF72 domain-containing protein [Dehalococcoidia bacterium]|jgi:uncharacterized protein YecE (DUF72 family)|nr:DUF72 domain-containing protein [Dehalococcoidia bacterium]